MDEYSQVIIDNALWAIEQRLDAIERRVGLGKYAPVMGLSYDQVKHGERVEARRKANNVV